MFHKAVIRGNINLIILFLELGLDPNVKNKQGYTLISLALFSERFDIVEIFLRYKVNIFIPDNNGLMFLDYYDFKDLFTIKNLLLKNYKLSLRSHHNNLYSIHSLEMAINTIDYSSEIKYKTSLKNVINHFIKMGWFLKSLIKGCNDIEVIKNLLKNNICIDIFYSNSLVYEILDREDVLELLIDHGVYIMDDEVSFNSLVVNLDLNIIKRLFKYGINFYATDDNKNSLVKSALNHSKKDLLIYLIYNCNNIEKYFHDCSLYEIYNLTRSIDICKHLIEHNISIKSPLLHLTIRYEELEFTEYLIKKGYDINMVFKSQTPLHIAIQYKRIKHVKYLIDNNAKLNCYDFDGNTPLLYAIDNILIEIVNILIKRNVNVNVINVEDKNALIYAIEKENIEIVKLLLNTNININKPNSLLYAIEKENMPIIKLLLKQTSIIIDKEIMMYVVSNNKYEIFLCLIEHEATLDLQDVDMIFNGLRYFNFIKYFLEHNLDINIKSHTNHSLLYHAFELNDLVIFKILLDYGANINDHSYLFNAIEKLDVDLISLLVNNGVDVNQRDKDGNTPLIYLLKCIPLIRLNYMVHDGFYYLPLSPPIKDLTILLKIMQILVENKAHINLKNNLNETALSIAININEFAYALFLNIKYSNQISIDTIISQDTYGDYILVDYLVDHGADVNVLNEYNETLFSASMRYIPSNILVKMIEHGANLNVIDYHKNTPLEQAIERNDNDLINSTREYKK